MGNCRPVQILYSELPAIVATPPCSNIVNTYPKMLSEHLSVLGEHLATMPNGMPSGSHAKACVKQAQ